MAFKTREIGILAAIFLGGSALLPAGILSVMLWDMPNLSLNPDASPAALARRPLGAG